MDSISHNYAHATGRYDDLLKNGKLKKKVLKEGKNDGYHPGRGDIAHIHYDAKDRKTGKTYFSTIERGEIAILTVSDFQRTNLKGLDVLLPSMSTGEIARLIAKPEHAYGVEGNRSNPKVPPNTQIIFEVELVQWEFGDNMLYDPLKSITKSVQKDAILGAFPGLRYRLKDKIPIVNISIKGWLDNDGQLGREFMDKTVEFEIGECHEHDLPDGIDTALQRFHEGERSLLRLRGVSTYKNGNEALGIPSYATVVFEVTLNKLKLIPAPTYETAEERLNDCEIFKDKGSAFFALAKYDMALKKYKYVVELLCLKKEKPFLKGTHMRTKAPIDDSPDCDGHNRDLYRPLEDWGDRWEERQEMLIPCALNAALCCAKLGDARHAKEGVQLADEVLNESPGHIKALYRRAQCWEVLKDFDEATDDYRRMLAFEPHHKAARQSLRRIKRMGGLLEDVARDIFGDDDNTTVYTTSTMSSFYQY